MPICVIYILPKIISGLGGLLALSAQCQINAPRFLQTIKANGDTPVVIEWESQPSAVFTVEYSVGLNNDWQQVELGFPAQGTTTRWTDRGNPAADGFRLSSGDALAPYRFYRLKVERLMDTSLPITVSVSSPSPGATLTGEVQVQGTASASQGLASVKVLVDGYVVSRARGPSFSLPVETRFFANGSHRISVIAEDIGAIESTEEPNDFSPREASYGVQNINVTFDNLLTDARLRYEHFRPELGQMQQIFAVWSTSRNWSVDVTSRDGSVVYRSFSGAGRRVAVDWDGRDAANQMLNPQVLAYVFNDLGPAPEPPPGGGGGGAPPSPAMAAVAAGQDSYFVQSPPMPPIKKDGKWYSWEEIYGPLPPIEVKISEKQRESILAKLAADGSTEKVAEEPAAGPAAAGQAFVTFGPYSLIGTIAIAGQGHHPAFDLFGRYPTPPRTFGGNVRMSSRSEFGPWGRLKRVKGIVDEAAQEFAKLGYAVLYKKLDDQVLPEDIAQDPFGLPNIFNRANVGLFVGHSVAAKDAESGFIWRQAYVPIYNSVFDSMTFVGSSSMNFGSEQLKWMAFFSCNMFRSDFYRPDGIYEQQKNFFALPMNGYLHIMQGFATENSVHPDMPFYWTLALRQSPIVASPNYSVIGAWNYVCRRTQPTPTMTDPVNVARSLTWPECQADFIFGYGSQTEPNRNPTDPEEQEALLEIDHAANSPEP